VDGEDILISRTTSIAICFSIQLNLNSLNVGAGAKRRSNLVRSKRNTRVTTILIRTLHGSNGFSFFFAFKVQGPLGKCEIPNIILHTGLMFHPVRLPGLQSSYQSCDPSPPHNCNLNGQVPPTHPGLYITNRDVSQNLGINTERHVTVIDHRSSIDPSHMSDIFTLCFASVLFQIIQAPSFGRAAFRQLPEPTALSSDALNNDRQPSFLRQVKSDGTGSKQQK
jgi:hypothetical protein